MRRVRGFLDAIRFSINFGKGKALQDAHRKRLAERALRQQGYGSKAAVTAVAKAERQKKN